MNTESIGKVMKLVEERARIDKEIVDEMVRACTVKPVEAEEDTESMVPAKRLKKCSACGKPGHQAKTCVEGRGEALSEETFLNVKAAMESGTLSKDIANDLELDLGEVNLAISSYDYTLYLHSRK